MTCDQCEALKRKQQLEADVIAAANKCMKGTKEEKRAAKAAYDAAMRRLRSDIAVR